MEVVVVRDAAEVGRVSAALVAQVVTRDPEAVLGLATGSSPTGIYASLAARVAAGELDLAAPPGSPSTSTWGSPSGTPSRTRR